MGLERDKGMEGKCVRKGHGYGRDMIMEGTRVWRGQGYGRDNGMEPQYFSYSFISFVSPPNTLVILICIHL